MYERSTNSVLAGRLREPRRSIQVLTGPRQVGKTTAVRQVLETLGMPSHYATADTATLQSRVWLEAQWLQARAMQTQLGRPVVLAIDEVQKVPAWSEVAKRLWDEDSFASRDVRVVLTGSSPLGVQRGLSESLAGRFETVAMTHWAWPECRDAFGWDVETFIFYGGYPGAASLIDEPGRWRSYVLDSIVETTVSRDILLMTRVDKPALLRRVFHVACEYAGRELTYERIVGQMHDAGNTTTVAHYLDLLDAAGLVSALQKFASDAARRRRSTPKFAVHNTALISAVAGLTMGEARADARVWGRFVEAAVGAHLLAEARRSRLAVHYWRSRVRGVDVEVDYVTVHGQTVTAIEVKSGAPTGSLEGLAALRDQFGPRVRTVLVGTGGTALADFLAADPAAPA